MQGAIARPQFRLTATDLELVLALARGGTLAAAAERLSLNASTVFRQLQRIERGVGSALFARGRHGYVATELGQRLVEQGEHVEAAVEAARAAARQEPGMVSGTVRITTTDTVLHALVAPALPALQRAHPGLSFDLRTGNQLASLTRRDADIAVRATVRPPAHLVGRSLGPIRVALFAADTSGLRTLDDVAGRAPAWIAPDEALPEHPSVAWRRRAFPDIVPRYRVDSILAVAECVALGMGVGVLPLFLAARMPGLHRIGEEIEEARTGLWLLTHPDARHLRRVATVYAHLGESLRLT